ncbi:MAG: Two component regulator propeller, partial [Chthonomonadales bacterium]|nr:Two component regulator propeller [Chthonomonadales bacterium]
MAFLSYLKHLRLSTIAWCLACLLCAPPAAVALDTDKSLSQCRLDVWTTKDGLPTAAINAMAQTPDGYLWLATNAGLVRFDGVTFQTFNSRNTPGLKR